MANDNLLYDSSTGHLMYDSSTGHLIYGDPDNCECCGGGDIEAGDDCEHCDGTTPKYWTMTVSGASTCTGCYSAAGTTDKFKLVDNAAGGTGDPTISEIINDSRLLTQTAGDACLWRASVTVDWDVERYDNTDCSGTADDTANISEVLFELTKTDTTYTLYVYGSGVFGNNFDQVFVYLFSDTITPTTEDDCTETQSGSNDRSCGSLTSQSGGPGVLWFFMSGANGGSVTLEAGDAT